jgi:hypothetical protein
MPPADAHVCVARMMDHNGRPDLALVEYSEALRVDPNHEMARLALSSTSPADGIPAANPIQTVSYQQYAPAPKRPAPPLMGDSRSGATPAGSPPDPLPMSMNRTDLLLAPTPFPGPMQPR